jgi:hypothetical protein
MWRRLALTLLPALLLARLTGTAVDAAEPANEPVTVVQAFLAAWNAHDPDAVVALFADDDPTAGGPAVVVCGCSGGVRTGRAEIRTWTLATLAYGPRVADVTVLAVAGDTVIWTYRSTTAAEETKGTPPAEATAGAVVEAGKLTRLDLTLTTPEQAARNAAAKAAAQARAAAVVRARPGQQPAGATALAPPGSPQRAPDTQGRGSRSIAPWASVILIVLLVTGLAMRKRPHDLP